jgi:solute carrier family 25 uncoupling protein 8/9
MESSNVFKGLLYGGFASCIAETCTMPVDVVKTRLQMDGAAGQKLYRGPLDCAGKLVKADGPSSLFKGLPPALLRQSTYGSLRYGLYGPIRDSLGVKAGTPKTEIPIWKKILAGGTAGALASAVASPTDLIKVRLQTDGQMKGKDGAFLPKKYRGMPHAFLSIVREEGVLGLWKGTTATAARATVLAATELATYDEVRGKLLQSVYFEEGLLCTVCTATVSGLLATIASSPFDVVKSRFMGQPLNADGTGRIYRDVIHCFVKSTQTEGVSVLYNGFWPNFGRVVPRVVIVFIVMENLKAQFG